MSELASTLVQEYEALKSERGNWENMWRTLPN